MNDATSTHALTLYLGNKNYSSWSLRAWLVLTAAGVPFRESLLDISDSVRRDPTWQASPSKRVPVLHDGNVVIWDSLAIAEYVAESFPHAGLWPDDWAARAVARSTCAEMHSSFQALRANMPMNVRAALPGKGRAPGVQEDIDRITAIWRECRTRHGAVGNMLFGRFSIADAFYAPVVTRFRTYHVDVDPVSRAYCEAVLALPAMRKWCAEAETAPAEAKYD